MGLFHFSKNKVKFVSNTIIGWCEGDFQGNDIDSKRV